MVSSNGLLSTLGWFIIPNLLTSTIQNIYYQWTGNAVVKGHVKYQRHRRNIYVMVVGVYIIYSIIDAYWSVVYEGSPIEGAYEGLYTVLGVDPRADYQQIRSAYRKLGTKFHPDKTTSLDDHDTWMTIKSSYEVLSDPILRFGYDRFGWKVLAWKTAATRGASTASFTMIDILRQGLRESIFGYYLMTCLSIISLNILGYAKEGQHWRYFILLSALLVEISITTRSSYTTLFPGLNLIPFQSIALMRRLIVSIFIGINQIAPHFGPPVIKNLESVVDEIETLSKNIRQESQNFLAFEYTPFSGERDTIKKRIVEQMLELRLRADPEVADATLQATSKLRR